MPIDFQKRIEEKLQQYIPITESGCHIWLGGVDKDGYGKIQNNKKHLRAHRVSYEFYVGIIPEGMLVRHTCDIPSCINPTHLLVGTPRDNSQDSLQRLRNYVGIKNARAILTEEQVSEIKNSHLKVNYFMRKYNISRTAVRSIRIGRSWSHLNER